MTIKLTAEQKVRVRIAKDVIKQLNSKKLKQRHNKYFMAVALPNGKRNTKKPCEVCALGSMFVVKYGIPTELYGLAYEEGVLQCDAAMEADGKLTEFFERRQLHLIENYFEGKVIGYNDDDPYVEPDLPEKPWSIRRIMKNIISNRGEFVPVKARACSEPS